jgi:hypothetical protein
LADAGDDRRVFSFHLNRLINHSKNPCCFAGCTLACTGFAFLIGDAIGEGAAVGEGTTVAVGVGFRVGLRVGILVGMFVGVPVNTAFL